ncbi:MAG: prolipoprotein diacylglyceryl transferase [Syntrophorhabdaceae bacterium]|nr:prolipoprotein diacylglyceryl transferase [Syntrophorhabdales bacterium]MBP9561161.1 prolipoprotein diacylglyceryl transferase [Syntrophorhabdaceae bacterium]
MQFPNIDPVIFSIGPLSLRWYGLMYILGFTASYLLVLYQIKYKTQDIKKDFIDDLFFYLIIGLIVGARLGYIIFYNLRFYIQNPLEIFILWHGGLSFHGGLIGTFIAGYLIIKKRKMDFFKVADLVIPTCPIGLGFGRIGNFINGELYGKPSDLPWAMVFPNAGPLPRHPSQLYEASLEGMCLFIILWFYKDKKKQDGDVFAMFLMLYGIFRIFCELFREPDAHLGYISGILTMGQVLSIIMLCVGLFLKFYLIPSKKSA